MEEANGNDSRCLMVIERALKALKTNAVELSRDEWMAEAEKAEKAGAPATAQAVIKCVIEMEVEEEDFKHVWMTDAGIYIFLKLSSWT